MRKNLRYIMIGGFLGAGKTSALARLGRQLSDEGLRVGLITNDQSVGLVDTKLLRSQGFSVEEIAGGCFCCRFDSLAQAANRLDETTAPDVFLAEPVGSCTDLVATVSYPLRRIYGDRYSIAPLSVLVDPIRAARILGLKAGPSFSSKVVYVYRKQLEEADLLIVNKCDLIDPVQQQELTEALEQSFPRARVLRCSIQDGSGLEEWFDILRNEDPAFGPAMDVDYQLYGEGEALLGWLNASIQVASQGPTDGNRLLLDLARTIQAQLRNNRLELAHLKMTLDPGWISGDLSVVSSVRGDSDAELRHSLPDDFEGQAGLILNLRAEGDPEALWDISRVALLVSSREGAVALQPEHFEFFRPGQPTPTHRIADPQAAAPSGPA